MTTQIKGDATSTFGSDIDVTGNVVTDAPAFSARLSADQSVTTATTTKIQFDQEDFDLTSDYDNSTNYRFTPSVAGYYQVNAVLRAEGTSLTQQILWIYKNGAERIVLELSRFTGTTHVSGSDLVYCNGTSDYIEIYGRVDATSPKFGGNSTSAGTSFFSAYLARAV